MVREFHSWHIPSSLQISSSQTDPVTQSGFVAQFSPARRMSSEETESCDLRTRTYEHFYSRTSLQVPPSHFVSFSHWIGCESQDSPSEGKKTTQDITGFLVIVTVLLCPYTFVRRFHPRKLPRPRTLGHPLPRDRRSQLK